MDYTTNPVQVTPGPQPVASGPVSAASAGSGVLNFNRFLQSASTETVAVSTAPAVGEKAENSSANNSVLAAASTAANVTAAAQLATTENDDNGLASFLMSSKPSGNSPVIAASQTQGSTALPVDLVHGEVVEPVELDGILVNGTLQQALAVDVSAKHAADARQIHSEITPAATRLTVNPEVSSQALTASAAELQPALSKTAEISNGVVPSAIGVAKTTSPIIGGPAVTQDTVTNLADTKPAATDVIAGKGVGDSAIPSQALNSIDSVLKMDRGMPQVMLQGANGQSDNTALVRPHGPAPISAATPNELRVTQIPTGVELSSPQGTGITVSASMATAGVAQGLVSRQRNNAANDESVSQIARGGNEARLLELNGARPNGTPAHAPAASISAVETATELDAKHINAVTLAATRDEKSLRTAAPVVNQAQMAARIGGVDVTQIGAVDFATAQIDTVQSSPTVSRIAILEPGWTNQLGTDLRALVARGTSTTQVQVTPAELGPLDIEVSVNRQEVSVRILAMHGQTREMLEAALPRLREVLGQSYTSVDVSVGNGSGNSSSHGQSQHAGGQAGTMQMMSDAQDGMRDPGTAADSGRADEVENGDGLSEPVDDNSDSLADGSLVKNSVKPSRGLVDAYA